MSCQAQCKRFVSAVSSMVLGVILLYCTPPVNASGDQPNAEPNDLRWDLAEGFEFRWTGVELSAKVDREAGAGSVKRILTISAELCIHDAEGLVTVDVDWPGIIRVSDGHGETVPHQRGELSSARWYDISDWLWHRPHAPYLPCARVPFNMALRLPDDPNEPVPSSPGVLEGYVYVLYANDVISLDISFDPNGGWYEPEAAPGLQICVDPTTPPCPGRLQYVPVSLLPGSSKGLGSFPYRPTTPVPLYMYTTWIKSMSGAPVMALRDRVGYCRRDEYPLGDYAILRTELYDSVDQKSVNVPTQEAGSGIFDVRGTYCWGQMEQGRCDAYDTIRHIIVVHPVEVKIPFLLRDVPIPGQ